MVEWRNKEKEDKINKEIDAFIEDASDLKHALNNLIDQVLLLVNEFEDKDTSRKRQKQIAKAIHNFYVKLDKYIEGKRIL